ncbi:MAG: hypothetical protein Q8M11_21335 [Sulfuritalea sp.]|nr:hypothetical protein [Sulfuritalea sp.]MDP1983596.1 hypothetical protein [Sulfuritalea sp.]
MADITYGLMNGKPVDSGWVTVIALLLGGFAFGRARKRRPVKQRRLSWVSLAIALLAFAGVVFVADLKDSNTIVMIGIVSMFIGFIVWYFSLGVAIASELDQSNDDQPSASEERKAGKS